MLEKKKIEFIDCDECRGLQLTDTGKDCKHCSGYGVGTFFYGHFLYWKSYMNRTSITIRRIKKTVDTVINMVSLFFILLGIGSLAIWYWRETGDQTTLNPAFWQYRDPLVMAFWIFSTFSLFTIYRFDQERRRNLRIKSFGAGAVDIPDNWQELRKFKKIHNIYSALGEEAEAVLESAYLLAAKSKNKEVKIMHLMAALLRARSAGTFFARLNVPIDDLLAKVNKRIDLEKKNLKFGQDIIFGAGVKKVFLSAFTDAYSNKQNNINALNLISPAVENDQILEEILIDMKVDRNKIENTKRWFEINEEQYQNYQLYRKMAKFKPKTNMDRAYTAVATPTLNTFAYDLTLVASWGRLELCVAREKEINSIFENFKSGSNGIILVGPEGVGKKSIIEGIAREMVKEEDIPDYFKDKRLIELDVARLISGAEAAQAEERLLTILDEINRAGNIVLYIEDIENMAGISSGGEESLELSEVLANAIERKYLCVLSSATDMNYSKYIEDTAIGNSMARVIIKEPEGDQAIHMLESKVSRIESKFRNIFFSYNAVEAAINFSSKYIHDKYLPHKAVGILEKTAAMVSSKHAGSKKRLAISKNDIAKTVHEITDIPTQDIEMKESEKLLNLEEEIHKQMINQNEAVNVVSDSLRRARVELREGKRPIASFLFMGPTGVGKTELAKTITGVYFGRKEYMIRLDMSEYQHQDSVKKMIGSSDGTKGYLTEQVRKKPFALILLDEFEKAHPKIFDLFLQVMDDGRLTDGEGRTINFTNSILIATSNAGSNYIQDEIRKGTSTENIKTALINEHLNRVLRPELINRFDGIIVFKPLSEDNVREIAHLMLGGIAGMLKEKGILFEASPEGVAILAREGYDPKFGARPLRRLLREKIENEIAIKILAGEIERRDTIIVDEQAKLRVKKGREL